MEDGSPEGRYANAFSVGFNAFELVLDFGQRYTDQLEAQVHSRIVTSPPYAKRLLRTLTESLARYEESYGEIPEGGDATEGSLADEAGPAALATDRGRVPYGRSSREQQS